MLVNISKYYQTNSLIHKLNPIIKVISTIVFVILCFLLNTKEEVVVLSIFTLILLLLSNIPFNIFIKSLKSLTVFLIFMVIVDLLIKVKIDIILFMVVKIVLVVLYTSLLILTTKMFDLTASLEKVFSPLKILKLPVNKIALSLTLALRFIPSIIDEANNILFAYKTRGIDYNEANIKNKLKIISNILMPMFILSIRKADNLALVMEARNYDVNGKRSSLNKWQLKLTDIIYLFIHIILLVIIVVKR